MLGHIAISRQWMAVVYASKGDLATGDRPIILPPNHLITIYLFCGKGLVLIKKVW